MNDLLTSVTIVPSVLSFLNGREAMWFSNYAFCAVSAVLWMHIAQFSVFLTGILSVTRTLILLNPLRRVKKSIIIGTLCVYAVYINLQTIPPLVSDYGYFYFNKQDVGCWEKTNKKVKWYFISKPILTVMQLAVPILPILTSCVISTWVILSSMKVSDKNTAVTSNKRSATVTIVYVTVAYIIFNIPMFVNQALYLDYKIKKVIPYPDPYWNSVAMYWYSWNFTNALSVAMNAAMNPVIYFWRIRKFRSFVFGLFTNMYAYIRNKPYRHSLMVSHHSTA